MKKFKRCGLGNFFLFFGHRMMSSVSEDCFLIEKKIYIERWKTENHEFSRKNWSISKFYTFFFSLWSNIQGRCSDYWEEGILLLLILKVFSAKLIITFSNVIHKKLEKLKTFLYILLYVYRHSFQTNFILHSLIFLPQSLTQISSFLTHPFCFSHIYHQN